MWSQNYAELYSASFTTVATHQYTQNKTFTLSGKSWTASVSQVNGSVFYLGCNSNNASKGVLGNNSTFSAVNTALTAEDNQYTSGTDHAYALLFDNSYSDVTKVVFEWDGGNNAFQVYLFGDSGSGYVLLNKRNYASSGTSVSGSVEWTGTSTNFTKFAIVARPGTTSTTATNKTLRASKFRIYKTATVPVTNITLNKIATTIEVGNTETLSVTSVLPDNATDKTYTWSSANDDIATVDPSTGEVTAVAIGGPVNITATAHDGSGVTASCAVTVVDAIVAVTGVELNKPSTTLLVGGTETLTATVSPNDATDKSVSWESDDEDVATVDGGVVTAVGVGTATITVKSVSDPTKTATCEVTVNPVVVNNVALNKASTSIVCGSTETLTAIVSPNNATNKNVSWESSNATVASVENGVVTANAVGLATITVITEDQNETATCTITVTANSTKPEITQTIFEETFTGVTTTANQALNLEELDNEGWTKAGSVYGGTNSTKMAKGDAGGSLTTPVISGMKTGATLMFLAKGWDGDETSISLSGTDCTVSPTSFNDLPYGDDFATKSVTITVTGSNPKITFTAASGVRIYLGEITITQTKSSVDVILNTSGFASYCSPFALDLTPNNDFAAYAVKAAGSEAKNQVVFTKIPGKVVANTPFILYNPDKASTAVSLPIIEEDDEGIAAVSANELVGTLSPTYTTAASDQTNFGLSGAKFVPMKAGVVKANKAYLPVSNDCIDTSSLARDFKIVFAEENTTTGITNVSAESINENVPMYNLAGQHVTKAYKGVVIVNGKKMLNK